MLKLLQPGIEPLGQFDMEDDDMTLVRGGEVAVFEALDLPTDAYAADVPAVGPQVHLHLDQVDAAGILYGLVDEGTTDGSPNNTNYGTLFGTVIGVTAGQATGLGTQSGRAVVIGPSTMLGSGKATLWTKPGLYGTTVDAWADSGDFDTVALNDAVFGTEDTGGNAARGKLLTGGGVQEAALAVGAVVDPSLVSTTTVAAGDDPVTEHLALYLLGVQV